MPQDENGNYTDLSEERKEHFWNYFTITSPIDPETHLEAWPDTVFKQKYMPIFPLPSFTNIVKEEPMNLTVYTRSSLFSWQNRLSMHSWDLDQFSKECGLMPINYKDFVFPPGEITDDVEKKYRALRETILVFHITDRGFERGSRNGDCFDLKFFNSVNGQTATHAQVWNGDKVRVPDLVTRDFLNDVARYVEREENMWDNLPNEEYWKWHNSFVRDAVLRELLHASVRKFRYMNDLGELEPLLEWVHERGASDAGADAKAQANAFVLLRKTAWWFLWATFVGYASIIRFPENRQRMRTRLPKLIPAVWPLPFEHFLSGQHKSDDPIAPPSDPTPDPAPAPDPPPTSAPPAPAKVYRLNRMRAAF